MKFFVSLTPLTHVAALCMLAFAAQAQSAAAVDEQAFAQQLQQRQQARTAERAEMEQLRQQISQRQAQAEKACWQRFAVEDCLRSVRAQERGQLNQLRERELRINQEERQEKADQRLREIERRQQQGPSPSHVQVLPRNAPPVEANQPKAPAATKAEKTPADIAREQAQRHTDAQQRAAEQAQRLQAKEAAVAERTLTEAERRNRVKKNMQQNQEQALLRQQRKADDIAQRKGAPLPIPQGLPVPPQP